MIAWESFTPLPSLAGGLLIGLAAALLILLNGRIAGVSSILGGLLVHKQDEFVWQLLFVVGLVVAPLIYGQFETLPHAENQAHGWLLAIAGLLVGLGTRYGSGCTSGHGVCGLSRLSLRSLVATLTFMAAGFITVFFTRHVFA
jgi:hypothetical protein